MPGAYQKLVVETRNKLRILRFDNQRKKNAWDRTIYLEITRALWEANDDVNITAVVLTGTGDFYSSGNDVGAAMERAASFDDPAEARKDSSGTIYRLVDAFICFKKLLIAVVNGPCFGIAATTAALCDVVYATKSVSQSL